MQSPQGSEKTIRSRSGEIDRTTRKETEVIGSEPKNIVAALKLLNIMDVLKKACHRKKSVSAAVTSSRKTKDKKNRPRQGMYVTLGDLFSATNKGCGGPPKGHSAPSVNFHSGGIHGDASSVQLQSLGYTQAAQPSVFAKIDYETISEDDSAVHAIIAVNEEAVLINEGMDINEAVTAERPPQMPTTKALLPYAFHLQEVFNLHNQKQASSCVWGVRRDYLRLRRKVGCDGT